MLPRILLLSTLMVGAIPGGGGGGPNIGVNTFRTNFSPIGPFEAYCDDYELKGSYRSTVFFGKIVERVRVGVIDKEKTYSHFNGERTISKNVVYDVSFNLPFHSMLTDKGLEIIVDFLNTSNTVLHSFTFRIKPCSKNRIYPKDYLNTYYSVSDVYVDPDNYQSLSEKYTFNGFIDYFNNDYYYRLNLDSIYLTYVSNFPFNDIDCDLLYEDYEKAFPYLDNDDDEVHLPMTTYHEGDIVKFKMKNSLFVNKKTLEMHFNYQDGLVSTNYFYLPVNKIDKILDSTFTLSVNDFGYNKTYFTWNIRYITNKSLIGNCSSSDYCVVGDYI